MRKTIGRTYRRDAFCDNEMFSHRPDGEVFIALEEEAHIADHLNCMGSNGRILNTPIDSYCVYRGMAIWLGPTCCTMGLVRNPLGHDLTLGGFLEDES